MNDGGRFLMIGLLILVVVLVGVFLFKNRSICYSCEETTISNAEQASFASYLKQQTGGIMTIRSSDGKQIARGALESVQAGYMRLDDGTVIPVSNILVIQPQLNIEYRQGDDVSHPLLVTLR